MVRNSTAGTWVLRAFAVVRLVVVVVMGLVITAMGWALLARDASLVYAAEIPDETLIIQMITFAHDELGWKWPATLAFYAAVFGLSGPFILAWAWLSFRSDLWLATVRRTELQPARRVLEPVPVPAAD